MVEDGGEDVVDFLENGALFDLSLEGIDYLCSLFPAKLLVLQQLVRDHKTLIISLLNRLLDLVVVGLDGQIHALHLLINALINFELLVFLNRQVNRHVRVDGDM